MRSIRAVAAVQAAKLRRLKMVWIFGLAPFALSAVVAGPTIVLMNRPEVLGAELQPLFSWSLILGWGSFLSLAGRFFALILGTMTVDRDIREGTLFPLLAKPVSRARALLGKYLGSAAIMAVYFLIEAVIMIVAMTQAGADRQWTPVLTSLVADFVAFAAMLALGLVLGLVLRPALGLGLVFFALVWLQLTEPLLKSSHPVWNTLGWIPAALFPKPGEMTLWIDVTASSAIDPIPLALRLGYALAWMVLLLVIALWRFERKELIR